MTEPMSLWEDVKPPYRHPTMDEIRAIPPNGLTAVSTFSGGGGSSLGLKRAGWTIPYAVEFIPMAAATYRANFPDTFVDERDIRTIQPEDILDRIGMEPGQLDLFEGSPPCSSFSMSNTSADAFDKVKTYSDGVKQSTHDLFDEWLRILAGLMPRAILAENVPGMVMGDQSHSVFSHVCSVLSSLGYEIKTAIMDSSHFGAATSRRRLIFIGYRRDVGLIIPTHPKAMSERYSYAEAMAEYPGELPEDELAYSSIVGYSIHPRWEKLKPGEQDEERFNLIRMDPDKPMPTLTKTADNPGSASICHPFEPRKMTATEGAWLTGYPLDYINLGKPAQRIERIGRAVPPPLYEACGKLIARELLDVDRQAAK